MLKKDQKGEIVKDLENALKQAKSVVFVNFHGIHAGDETNLRHDFRNQGVNYKVSRKTLLKRALSGKAEGELPELSGEVAMAYGADDIAPAREVFNFQKTHKDMLKILGGIFEGQFVNGARMMEIATIPSREVLLSKLAFLFQSPMQRLAIGLSEVAKGKN